MQPEEPSHFPYRDFDIEPYWFSFVDLNYVHKLGNMQEHGYLYHLRAVVTRKHIRVLTYKIIGVVPEY